MMKLEFARLVMIKLVMKGDEGGIGAKKYYCLRLLSRSRSQSINQTDVNVVREEGVGRMGKIVVFNCLEGQPLILTKKQLGHYYILIRGGGDDASARLLL